MVEKPIKINQETSLYPWKYYFFTYGENPQNPQWNQDLKVFRIIKIKEKDKELIEELTHTNFTKKNF